MNYLRKCFSWLSAKITAALLLRMFLILALLLIIVSCKAKTTNPLDEAILNDNWKAAYDICLKDSLFSKPETVGIMGHAAIKLNNNNTSLVLLKSIDQDSIKRAGWLAWTNNFVKLYSEYAVSHYLQGDAFMRNGNMEKALECFNSSIKIDPKYTLALNARGTLYAVKKDKIKATKDLNDACSLDTNIAEYYASRASMFFKEKVPEASLQDYEKALKINNMFALALNGKACALLFSTKEISFEESKLDTISKYLFYASSQLDLPFFTENKRSIMLEIENRMYPDQKESPLFRMSDFLNWKALRQLSISNKNDFFKFALKKPLPESINAQMLSSMNNLLTSKNIIGDYLKNDIGDSLKSVINNIIKNPPVSGKQKIEILNRIIIEKIYTGLIASSKKREPGMSVVAQSINTGMDKFRSTPMYGALKDFANTTKLNVGVSGTIGYKPEFKAYASADMNMGKLYGALKGTGSTMLNYAQTKIPGGALADVRRMYVDNDEPYYLLCLNGLGYDSK